MNSLVESLNKYGAYLNVTRSGGAFNLIYNVLEVCNETGLRPLVLCNATYAKQWKMVLAITRYTGAEVYSTDDCGGYVNDRNEVTVKFIDAQDILVVFHDSLPTATHIVKPMTGIIIGVTKYNKKFCVLGLCHWTPRLFISIIRSIHPRTDRNMGPDELAFVIDTLAKYGVDVTPGPERNTDLVKAINASFTDGSRPARTGKLKVYRGQNCFADIPKVVVVSKSLRGRTTVDQVQDFIDSEHGLLFVDSFDLGEDLVESLGNVSVIVHRRDYGDTSQRRYNPRSGTVSVFLI